MSYESEFVHDVDRAVVTGATGMVGAAVVERLAESGTHVDGMDTRRPSGTRPRLDFREVDLRDQADVWESVHEVDPDAVVHCAAISNPLDNPGTRVFTNNVEGTYNALVAAGRVDAEVVWTSSQAAYGALFGDDWVPDYLPIDESHELRPADPYGVSKVCGEEVAASVARRYGVPVTSLRPATVHGPGETRTRPPREDADLASDDLRGNFGSWVDVRDLARLVAAALAADRTGHEAVLCAADENCLGPPTADIVETVCGTLPERCELSGREAALSNDRARERFDWRPVYPDLDGGDGPETPAWV